MKRNNTIEIDWHNRLKQHRQCIAFHEAGHAVAICLNNRARNLSPVFFQILLKGIGDIADYDVLIHQANHDDSVARVEGGRLLHSLPQPIDGVAHKLIDGNAAMAPLMSDYVNAFETDIINLLVGPLAEAKYVHSRDDERFNHHLVVLPSLKNYGGGSDLALVYGYLESYSGDKQKQDEKLGELFALAFTFVNDSDHWKAITKLANYILESHKNIIGYKEVVAVLGL